MMKFKAVVEYDGTLYHGWQLQPQRPTIQGELEKVLLRLSGGLIRVHGAGRTDSGVHAVGQVAHFEMAWTASPEKLRGACNALLPKDILIRCVEPAEPKFHARHSALSKTYLYQILDRPLRSCFRRYYTWHVPFGLDVAKMNEAADHLLGCHDFAAFGAPTDGTDSTIREMLFTQWARDPGSGLLQFTITGSGFLRYMVRSLVGTLVMVGQGKISQQRFQDVLVSRNRAAAGQTAPPHGLFLAAVSYGNQAEFELDGTGPIDIR